MYRDHLPPGLDLIAAAPELEFPRHVTYKFLYWIHIMDNQAAASRLLADADVIAIETASARTVDGTLPEGVSSFMEAADNWYQLLNHITAGTATEEMSNFAQEVDTSFHARFARDYAGSGKKLVPVDAYIHSDDPDHITQYPTRRGFKNWAGATTLEEEVNARAEHNFTRESLSLRQLANIGANLPDSEGQKTVAVLYGAFHTPLFIAMRHLGARVERQFINKPLYFTAVQALERKLRFTSSENEDYKRLLDATNLSRLAISWAAADPAVDVRSLGPICEVPFRDAMLANALSRRNHRAEKAVDTVEDYLSITGFRKIFARRSVAQTRDAFQQLLGSR